MAFGMSLAVFSFVIEVTSFSRIVIWKKKESDSPCVCFSVHYLYLNKAWAYLYWSTNIKMTSYQTAGVTLTKLQQVYVWQCACKCVHSVCMAYSGFPAEDITVETEPILWQIKTALKQNVLLQSAGIVWGNKQTLVSGIISRMHKGWVEPSDAKVRHFTESF